MRLDRNTHKRGKYAIINLRRLEQLRSHGGESSRVDAVLQTLEALDLVEYCEPHSSNEFFVLRLKDRFSQVALVSYAAAACEFDKEYSGDVEGLASRAGPSSPWCKDPD